MIGSFGRDHEGMARAADGVGVRALRVRLATRCQSLSPAHVLAGLDRESLWSSFLITNTAIGLSAAPCGLLIARAKPDNPIGWLFLIMGIAHLLTAAATPAHDLRRSARLGRSSRLRLLVTINMFSWSWGVFCCLPLILQLFPTGKPVSRHWRSPVSG